MINIGINQPQIVVVTFNPVSFSYNKTDVNNIQFGQATNLVYQMIDEIESKCSFYQGYRSLKNMIYYCLFLYIFVIFACTIGIIIWASSGPTGFQGWIILVVIEFVAIFAYIISVIYIRNRMKFLIEQYRVESTNVCIKFNQQFFNPMGIAANYKCPIDMLQGGWGYGYGWYGRRRGMYRVPTWYIELTLQGQIQAIQIPQQMPQAPQVFNQFPQQNMNQYPQYQDPFQQPQEFYNPNLAQNNNNLQAPFIQTNQQNF